MHVENYLGRARWLVLVFLAAMFRDFLHVLFDPLGEIPSIGASGGISGLIAFYAFKYSQARLGFLLRYGFVIIPKWIQFPAWWAFCSGSCCKAWAHWNKFRVHQRLVAGPFGRHGGWDCIMGGLAEGRIAAGDCNIKFNTLIGST